jgi:hypothetical protein
MFTLTVRTAPEWVGRWGFDFDNGGFNISVTGLGKFYVFRDQEEMAEYPEITETGKGGYMRYNIGPFPALPITTRLGARFGTTTGKLTIDGKRIDYHRWSQPFLLEDGYDYYIDCVPPDENVISVEKVSQNKSNNALAFGLAGGVIGTIAGGPIGTAIGAVVGLLIGSKK